MELTQVLFGSGNLNLFNFFLVATQWLSLHGFLVPSRIFVAVSFYILIGNLGHGPHLRKTLSEWLGSWKGIPMGNLTGVCAGSSVIIKYFNFFT